MSSSAPDTGRTAACGHCSRPLTAEEQEYYGTSCERCETELHHAMQDERVPVLPPPEQIAVDAWRDRAIAAEAEAAQLRSRLLEAEKGGEISGRDPGGSGSRPSDQAASHPAPAGFDPSRGPAGMRRVTVKRYDAETGHFPWVDTWALEDGLQEARDKGYWCKSACAAGGRLAPCGWPLCGCDPYANALAALGIEARQGRDEGSACESPTPQGGMPEALAAKAAPLPDSDTGGKGAA